MKLTERQECYIIAILASIPRKTLEEFKQEVSSLTNEEKKHLERNLYRRVIRGDTQFEEAYRWLQNH